MASRFRATAIACALAALGATAGARSQPASVHEQIDNLFRRWTRATPGCAVAVDVKGESVVRAAYGMADLERDVPITIDTIFEAGSVS